MSQTANKPKYRCPDVDAFLQTLPGTTSSRVRRQSKLQRQETFKFACENNYLFRILPTQRAIIQGRG